MASLFAIGEYGVPQAMHDACPVSAQTTRMKALADDLDRTWHPTGYYSGNEMADIVGAVVQLTSKASTLAAQAFETYPTDFLRKATNDYSQVVRPANETYQPLFYKARQTGVPINAPGLKRWVVDVLRAAHKLGRMAELSICSKPWYVGAMQVYMLAFDGVVGVAKRIGKIVVKAGQAVLDAADTAIGLFPVVKWGVIIVVGLFAGVYAWNKISSAAEAGRRPINWARLNPVPAVKNLFQRRNTITGQKLLR